MNREIIKCINKFGHDQILLNNDSCGNCVFHSTAFFRNICALLCVCEDNFTLVKLLDFDEDCSYNYRYICHMIEALLAKCDIKINTVFASMLPINDQNTLSKLCSILHCEVTSNSNTMQLRLNEWMKKVTDMEIQNFIIPRDCPFLLSSVICFNQKWRYSFKPENVIETTFHDFENKCNTKVDLMWATNTFNASVFRYYTKKNNVSVIRLDLQMENEDTLMSFVFPEYEAAYSGREGFFEILDEIDINDFIACDNKVGKRQRVSYAIPTINIVSHTNYENEFSKITPLFGDEDVATDGIEQVFKLDLDAIGIMRCEKHVTNFDEMSDICVKLNRPFMFYCLNKTCNITLFYGLFLNGE